MQGHQEDDEVKQRRGNRLADVETQGLRTVGGCEAPAARRSVRKGAPNGCHGKTWHPVWSCVKYAPDHGEADKPLAEAPHSRVLAENTQVLKEERDLDEQQDERVCHTANVEDLERACQK